MKFTLYAKTETAWTAMLAAIRSAQKTVYLEMFIFHSDTESTHDFVSAFEQKAQEGVQVILLLDAIGSIALSRAVIERLRVAGVEVRFFRKIFHRSHRKLLIIDSQKAFLGGVNIAEEFRHWYDMHIAIEGPLVRPLVASFIRAYRFAGGRQDLSVPVSLQRKRKLKVRAWLLDHIPFIRKGALRSYYARKIESATKSIRLVTPYFIPARWLERALADAVRRGVLVQILIPAHTNHRFLDVANMHYASRAVEQGAHVFLVHNMNHAKSVVIDDHEAMVGSANLDSLSFERNGELGIFFTDSVPVHEVLTVVLGWIESAETFRRSEHGLSWWGRMLIPFVRLFSGVL